MRVHYINEKGILQIDDMIEGLRNFKLPLMRPVVGIDTMPLMHVKYAELEIREYRYHRNLIYIASVDIREFHHIINTYFSDDRPRARVAVSCHKSMLNDEYLKYIHRRAKEDLGKQLVELTGDIKTRYLPQSDPRLVTIEYTI